MKKIGALLVMITFCLNVSGCINSDDKDEKLEFPMIVTVFPVGTTDESYLIILSEDGTIETLLGTRKKIQMDESEYGNNTADWFTIVEATEKCELEPKEIKTINDLLNNISFSELQSQRTEVWDSWEKMLIFNSKAYYRYSWVDDDALTKLIDQIIEYSPIQVDIHGWS